MRTYLLSIAKYSWNVAVFFFILMIIQAVSGSGMTIDIRDGLLATTLTAIGCLIVYAIVDIGMAIKNNEQV